MVEHSPRSCTVLSSAQCVSVYLVTAKQNQPKSKKTKHLLFVTPGIDMKLELVSNASLSK